jgi:5-methylcytosine-specific restriction enzyme subunit McrC
LYQIFTYVKNEDYSFKEEPHEVAGMILYAKTEEEIQPDNSFMMHGNRIGVKTLDLNRQFAEIAGQVNEIAEGYFGEKVFLGG